MPTGMVWPAGVRVSVSAMTNSFQATRKPKSVATPSPGSDSGMTMRTSVCERAEAVDLGGLEQLAREVAEEAVQHPDHQRQDDRQVGDDQARTACRSGRATRNWRKNGSASAIGGKTRVTTMKERSAAEPR